MAWYLLIYLFIVWHVSFFFDLIQASASGGTQRSTAELYIAYFGKHQALLYTLVLILPIFSYDLLKFSHRIAGPLVRCRTLMRDMADGKFVPEFKPRKYDFMRDLFEAFNALIRRCNAQVTPDGPAPSPRTATQSEREVSVPG
jgi:hypothetical protein